MARWAGRGGLAVTILRFSHTQEATELLDPDSFFSGPRFFLQPRIRQQEAFGAHAAVAALRAVDDGTPALVLARNARGRPFRMHITDARDMVSGLLAAHDSAATIGETYNLGATDPVDFEAALSVADPGLGGALRRIREAVQMFDRFGIGDGTRANPSSDWSIRDGRRRSVCWDNGRSPSMRCNTIFVHTTRAATLGGVCACTSTAWKQPPRQ